MTVPYHSTTNMVVPHQMVPYQYGCAFMMAVPDQYVMICFLYFFVSRFME